MLIVAESFFGSNLQNIFLLLRLSMKSVIKITLVHNYVIDGFSIRKLGVLNSNIRLKDQKSWENFLTEELLDYQIISLLIFYILFTAAEYCKKLKSERAQMQNEADILKQEISSLNQAIRSVQ